MIFYMHSIIILLTNLDNFIVLTKKENIIGNEYQERNKDHKIPKKIFGLDYYGNLIKINNDDSEDFEFKELDMKEQSSGLIKPNSPLRSRINILEYKKIESRPVEDISKYNKTYNNENKENPLLEIRGDNLNELEDFVHNNRNSKICKSSLNNFKSSKSNSKPEIFKEKTIVVEKLDIQSKEIGENQKKYDTDILEQKVEKKNPLRPKINKISSKPEKDNDLVRKNNVVRKRSSGIGLCKIGYAMVTSLIIPLLMIF